MVENDFKIVVNRKDQNGASHEFGVSVDITVNSTKADIIDNTGKQAQTI